MFFISLNRKIIAVSAVVVFSAAMALFPLFIFSPDSVPDSATCDEAGEYSTAAGDENARMSFLSSFHIRVKHNPIRSDEVIIPEVFPKLYEDYNKLQKSVGLDLLPYKGKKAQRLVYKLKNGKGYVTLLIYANRVIGGHISSGIYQDAYVSLADSLRPKQ